MFYSTPLYSTPFFSTLLYSTPLCSALLLSSVSHPSPPPPPPPPSPQVERGALRSPKVAALLSLLRAKFSRDAALKCVVFSQQRNA